MIAVDSKTYDILKNKKLTKYFQNTSAVFIFFISK